MILYEEVDEVQVALGFVVISILDVAELLFC